MSDLVHQSGARIHAVVTAVVAGLSSGRFIEDALEALCVELGASSAWSTLETKGHGPIHRSRTTSFKGASPAILAQHVTETLHRVQAERDTIAGPVPYGEVGSFVAVPLWSDPARTRDEHNLAGAIYLEFPADRGVGRQTISRSTCVRASSVRSLQLCI